MKKNKNTVSRFYSFKHLDECIKMGLVFGISLWFISDRELGGTAFICVSFFFVVVDYFMKRVVSYKSFLEGGKLYQRKYEGNIDNLIHKLYEVGLTLKQGQGSNYIFSIGNLILPNNEFLIRDNGSHCRVSSGKTGIRLLEKEILLEVNDTVEAKDNHSK